METGVKWYITRGQQRIGPIDSTQLKHMASTGQLGAKEYVWKEGMAQWIQAGQVQGLFDHPTPAAQPVSHEPAHTPVQQYASTPVRTPEADPVAAPTTPTPAQQITTTTAQPVMPPVQHTPTPAHTPRPTPQFCNTAHHSIQPALTSQAQGGALLAIFSAILMLLTFAIPWGSAVAYAYGPKTTIFSWTMIGRAFDSGQAMLGVWIIISWSVAVLTIVFAMITRGITRASIFAGLGLIVVICFIIVAFQVDLTQGPFKSGAKELETPLTLINACLLFVLAVVVHLTRRGGDSVGLRIMQIIMASAMLIITIILLITAFAASNSIWSQFGSYRVRAPWTGWLRVSLLVWHIGTLVATLLLLISGIRGPRRGPLTATGLFFLYFATLFAVVMDAIATAGAFNEWGSLLAAINAILLMLGGLLLFGGGLVQLIDHLRRSTTTTR